MTRRFVLAQTAVVLLAASVLAQPAAQARTTAKARTTAQARITAQAGAAGRGKVWPRQVYAPYFETWTSDRIPAVAVKSGARFFSLCLPPDG